MHRSTIHSMVLALVIGGMVGCMGESSEPGAPQTLKQGLTVLTAEDGHLALAYRQDDVVIYMEALRGNRTPDVYQADALSPLFEIDSLFTDDSGYIFNINKGGDFWLNPHWGDAIEEQWASEAPREGSNEALFRVATLAARTLREDIRSQIGEEQARDLAPEIDAIHSYAVQAHSEYLSAVQEYRDNLREQGVENAPTPADQPQGETNYGSTGPEDSDTYFTWGGGGTYNFTIRLHSDEMDGLPGYAGGWHSATQRRAFNSSGTWFYTHNSCNHGRCAYDLPFQSGSGQKSFHTSQLWAQNCDGPYAAGSDGDWDWLGSWGGDGHNCHDDARVQMYNFKYMATLGGHSRWCNGNDDDTDISVHIGGVELDQSGHPDYSSSCTRGYGWCP